MKDVIASLQKILDIRPDSSDPLDRLLTGHLIANADQERTARQDRLNLAEELLEDIQYAVARLEAHEDALKDFIRRERRVLRTRALPAPPQEDPSVMEGRRRH